jgi:hypothetical protein
MMIDLKRSRESIVVQEWLSNGDGRCGGQCIALRGNENAAAKINLRGACLNPGPDASRLI